MKAKDVDRIMENITDGDNLCIIREALEAYQSEEAISKTKAQRLVKEAKRYWKTLAKENGWEFGNRGVTVWIDKDGNLSDSLYNKIQDRNSYVVNEKGTKIYYEMKVN